MLSGAVVMAKSTRYVFLPGAHHRMLVTWGAGWFEISRVYKTARRSRIKRERRESGTSCAPLRAGFRDPGVL
jgi:hypothetical protein